MSQTTDTQDDTTRYGNTDTETLLQWYAEGEDKIAEDGWTVDDRIRMQADLDAMLDELESRGIDAGDVKSWYVARREEQEQRAALLRAE